MTFKKKLGTSLLLFASGVSGVSAADITRYAIADVSSGGNQDIYQAQQMAISQYAHPFIKFSIANLNSGVTAAKIRVYLAAPYVTGRTYQLRLVGANSDSWKNDDWDPQNGNSSLPGAPQLAWRPGTVTNTNDILPNKDYVEFDLLPYFWTENAGIGTIIANQLITAEVKSNYSSWENIVSSEGNDYKHHPRLILTTPGNPANQNTALSNGVPVPANPSAGGDYKFRMSVGMTHDSYEDPILFPGKKNDAHHHMFVGNGYVNRDSTPDTLKAERGTGKLWTNGLGANRSAYWVPVMYDQRGKPIPLGFHQIYYSKSNDLFGGEQGASNVWEYGEAGSNDIKTSGAVMPMPIGLTIVTQKGQHTKFSCLSHNITPASYNTHRFYNGPSIGYQDSDRIFTCNTSTSNYLQMKILFPDCWDGTNLTDAQADSNNSGIQASSHSHMTYSSNNGSMQSGCPAPFPVQLPQIVYQFAYPIQQTTDDTSHYYLSSDSDLDSNCMGYGQHGCSAHGDWMNGWEPSVMERLVGRRYNGTALPERAISCIGSRTNHCSEGDITTYVELTPITGAGDNFAERNKTLRDRPVRGFFTNYNP